MKSKRKTRKPKAQRTNLDKRIAAASPPLKVARQLRLAITGRDRPETRVETIVAEWKYLHGLQASLSKLSEGDVRTAKLNTLCREAWESAKKSAFDFIRDALHFKKPQMLIELARGMKHESKTIERKAMASRVELLQASAHGPVNLSEVARRLVDQQYAFAAKHGNLNARRLEDLKAEKFLSVLRSLRRIAHRLGVQTFDAGRPKK